MKRFPVGLTLTTALALAILVSLGLWQVKRLAWKEGVLARVAALRTAPAQPLGPLLADAARGADVNFRRVAFECRSPVRTPPTTFRYALREGQVGWRLLSVCRLSEGPYDVVVIDRGLTEALSGVMIPHAVTVPAAGRVVGVLRAPGRASFLDPRPAPETGGVVTVQALTGSALERLARGSGATSVAPFYIAVESESPAPAGLRPAALPTDIPNNHFTYALTWFGLAAALAGIYVSLLWARLRGA